MKDLTTLESCQKSFTFLESSLKNLFLTVEPFTPHIPNRQYIKLSMSLQITNQFSFLIVSLFDTSY
jgi:hypothetical protein